MAVDDGGKVVGLEHCTWPVVKLAISCPQQPEHCGPTFIFSFYHATGFNNAAHKWMNARGMFELGYSDIKGRLSTVANAIVFKVTRPSFFGGVPS